MTPENAKRILRLLHTAEIEKSDLVEKPTTDRKAGNDKFRSYLKLPRKMILFHGAAVLWQQLHCRS